MDNVLSQPALLRQLADCMDEKEALRAEVEALKAELQAVKMKVSTEEKRWFKNDEAAKFIGRSPAFLNKDRMLAVPKIPFSKHGHRTIKYDRADLEAYSEARRTKKGA